MFGGTVLVPVLTGFSPSTALFFSGVGTLIFLAMNNFNVPSYLGSSFAFNAPALSSSSKRAAQCGTVVCGLLLVLVGLFVEKFGHRWIHSAMPPIVTGTVIVVIAVNLAPAAWSEFEQEPLAGVVTAATIIVMTASEHGMSARLSIAIGVAIGTIFAAVFGAVNLQPGGCLVDRLSAASVARGVHTIHGADGAGSRCSCR